MTWLWRIFFSGLGVFPVLAATLSGSVRLVDSSDPEVHKRGDFSGVVVWIEPLNGEKPVSGSSSTPHARMVQKDKHFIPHVLAVRTGSIVDFPNYDPIFHNAFSSFGGQIFDVGLYPPGTTRSVEFRRSGIVHVFCNIHPSMSAVVVVLDTPWFGVSSRSGAFDIQGVPPGEYRLRVYHERATRTTLDKLERRVTLREKGPVLDAISISETGYVVTPHKNKFGKDYPPADEDNLLYHSGSK
ncbi:MAG: hypothetical protein LLG20_23690 [Acidobacteriales bacterium]|nr:hypothetical protein [Terriglobales bacterium]